MIRCARFFSVVLFLVGFCSDCFVQAEPAAEKQGYEWRQTDSSLALVKGEHVVWRLNFDKKEGKPYFHPVGLADGTELTCLRPADHPWHRALWFSWKFINGLNYWEEDPKTGLSPGRTEVVEVKAVPHDDRSAHIVMSLRYHPMGKSKVLSEMRVITVSAPDVNGRYRIDWYSMFTAGEKDIVLGRTPIPGEKEGQGWGGYAGLSIRMAKETRGFQFVDSEGRKDKQAHGKKARWVDCSGELPNGKKAGITIFDHPDNLRYPSPWYVEKGMPYFSPAVLFNKPYTIAARESMELWYRILIHPGRLNKGVLEDEWKAFGSLKGAAIAEVLEGIQQSKAAIRVDLLVCEVEGGKRIDAELLGKVKKLVGDKVDAGDGVDKFLRRVVQDKELTRDKLSSLTCLLGSKGYLNILMNPTLEVMDGSTAKVRSSYKGPTGKEITDSFEITPRILEDGFISMATEVVFTDKSCGVADGEKQARPPKQMQITNDEIRIRSGESAIIGGVIKTQKLPEDVQLLMKEAPLIDALFRAEDLREGDKETLFIVTATICEGDERDREVVRRR